MIYGGGGVLVTALVVEAIGLPVMALVEGESVEVLGVFAVSAVTLSLMTSTQIGA